MRKYFFDVKILIAGFIVISSMAFHGFLGVMVYEVNDDIGVISLLKGLFGYQSGIDGVFISPALGAVLHLFYKVFPAGPWFSLVLYAGMVLSGFLASYTALSVGRSLGGRLAFLFGVWIFVSLLTIEISFTATCLMLWVTAGGLLFVAIRRGEAWSGMHWLASGQLAFAYLLRPGLLPLLLAFMVPLLVAMLLNRSWWITRNVFLPLFVAMMFGCGFSLWLSGDASRRYDEFNQIRAEFTDTQRSSMTANTRAALFAVGWSYEDYMVMKNWWFHDGTIFSAKNIKNFLDLNSDKEQMFSVKALKDCITGNTRLIGLLLAWGGLWAMVCVRKRTNILWIFVLLCLFIEIFFLMGVRFPRRISVPGFYLLFSYGFVIFACESNDFKFFKFFKFIETTLSVVIVSGIFLIFSQDYKDVVASYSDRLLMKQYLDRSVMDVVEMNGKETVLADVSPHVLPLNYFPFNENDPILQVPVLGTGWLVESPVYLEQLRQVGLQRRDVAVPSMIDNRRMVLRFWDSSWLSFNSYVRGAFLQHLRQHYDVPASGRTVDVKILKDFRQNGNGVVYFQLVTVPS